MRIFVRRSDISKNQDIEIPDMNACFSNVWWSRHKKKSVTIKHHYRVNIFIAIIDQQQLNYRFNEHGAMLLMLSTTLDPKNTYKLSSDEDICLLVDVFYPEDFSNNEKIHLKFQLQHYELDAPNHLKLKNMSLISDLCWGFVET